jgi:hypothetical protein
MNKTCVNIACGDDYLNNWLNFDFAPHSATVKQANLLSRLPLADNSADGVYSSHFLEHIPRDLQAQPEQQQTMIDFVKQRTGHDLSSVNSKQAESRWTRLLKNPQKIRGKLEQWYCRAFLALLPSVFRQQNVSLASVGENHAWMYDFYTIERLLHQAGFVDVQRMSATRSSIPDFPYQSLDVTPDGQPRKGAESMYVEAVKT